MKEVMAVVRMNRINATKQALADAGISAFTARKVMGRGRGKVDYLLLKGAEEGYEEAISQLAPGPKLIPKRMLSVVVPDSSVSLVVRTIMETNQTGHPGDGKVFVCTVREAYRVRTGERDDAALDEALP
jgi:nitrogen regulatory protein PII 2